MLHCINLLTYSTRLTLKNEWDLKNILFYFLYIFAKNSKIKVCANFSGSELM